MKRFNDPDDRDRPPEDLTAWLAAGMRRVDAQTWRRWNFTLAEAQRWRAAGVAEALSAAQWQAAAVGAASVGDWLRAHITASEAIRWHEFGFDLDEAREHMKQGRNPDDAYRGNRRTQSAQSMSAVAGSATRAAQEFLQAGVSHAVLGSYFYLQWTDKDAMAWAREEIQAWDAKMWLSIGLAPAEAGELRAKNVTPAEVMRDWWRAGIPFDEVGDWLGAGLTAEEAVAQKESGVTVEQAAALRALRRGGSV